MWMQVSSAILLVLIVVRCVVLSLTCKAAHALTSCAPAFAFIRQREKDELQQKFDAEIYAHSQEKRALAAQVWTQRMHARLAA